jgi:hypothetical protein
MSEETPIKPAPAAKPAKPPAVEELPFAEFASQHLLPSLAQAFQKQGIVADLQLQLDLESKPIRLAGTWDRGQRQFAVLFSADNINAQKAFTCADAGRSPSTVEPFLVDERKTTLDLLVFGIMQRLNAQKWLIRN